jgi:hypothetical protein
MFRAMPSDGRPIGPDDGQTGSQLLNSRRFGNYRGTDSMADISRGAARHLKAWAEEVNGPVLHASTVMSAI